jgi:hypothetical protein
VGLLLLIPFYFLEFLKNNFVEEQLIVNGILVVVLSLFLAFANERGPSITLPFGWRASRFFGG